MPEPLLPVASQAKSKADEDKMSQALARLVAEDPTLRLENNAETHQLVLWCMGEAHADLLLDRLSTRYGVAVETVDLRVPLRETVAGKAPGLGRYVKQTGGHGEFGICHVAVEPLSSGDGFEFVDKIVGGVVPRQFIPSVEKGVRTQMEHGVLAGYPMVDIRVTLFDGKAHSVDSSDMAFQKAGRAALRDAAEKAQVLLLEPVPSGNGFEFVDKIVGGVVPRQFIPSVEKGVRAQMEQGVLAGYPMVDVRVTLFDGKAHAVDSSDMAFQKAGRAALRDAADKAKVLLLEPVDELSVLVADDYVGAVMSDLSSRRGRVLGTEPVAGGRTLVKAEVPQLELTRYAIDLRSMSHGTGSFSRSYLRHEPLPSHLADKVASASKPD